MVHIWFSRPTSSRNGANTCGGKIVDCLFFFTNNAVTLVNNLVLHNIHGHQTSAPWAIFTITSVNVDRFLRRVHRAVLLQ